MIVFQGGVPIGSMGWFLYLPTLEINAYGQCRLKNTSYMDPMGFPEN